MSDFENTINVQAEEIKAEYKTMEPDMVSELIEVENLLLSQKVQF